MFITPNLDTDMHDGSISQGDRWLAREVPKLLETDSYKNGGVIFEMILVATTEVSCVVVPGMVAKPVCGCSPFDFTFWKS